MLSGVESICGVDSIKFYRSSNEWKSVLMVWLSLAFFGWSTLRNKFMKNVLRSKPNVKNERMSTSLICSQQLINKSSADRRTAHWLRCANKCEQRDADSISSYRPFTLSQFISVFVCCVVVFLCTRAMFSHRKCQQQFNNQDTSFLTRVTHARCSFSEDASRTESVSRTSFHE